MASEPGDAGISRGDHYFTRPAEHMGEGMLSAPTADDADSHGTGLKVMNWSRPGPTLTKVAGTPA